MTGRVKCTEDGMFTAHVTDTEYWADIASNRSTLTIGHRHRTVARHQSHTSTRHTHTVHQKSTATYSVPPLPSSPPITPPPLAPGNSPPQPTLTPFPFSTSTPPRPPPQFSHHRPATCSVQHLDSPQRRPPPPVARALSSSAPPSGPVWHACRPATGKAGCQRT